MFASVVDGGCRSTDGSNSRTLAGYVSNRLRHSSWMFHWSFVKQTHYVNDLLCKSRWILPLKSWTALKSRIKTLALVASRRKKHHGNVPQLLVDQISTQSCKCVRMFYMYQCRHKRSQVKSIYRHSSAVVAKELELKDYAISSNVTLYHRRRYKDAFPQ